MLLCALQVVVVGLSSGHENPPVYVFDFASGSLLRTLGTSGEFEWFGLRLFKPEGFPVRSLTVAV